MTPAALVGWLLAGGGMVATVVMRREAARRLELVARACHEVRGPMCAARLGLHALGAEARGAAARRFAAVDGELRRAGLALDDLDAARAGRRARESRERIDVGELLRETADAWRPVAAAHGGRILLHVPAQPALVRGDRLRLAQACSNLVANAIEHGRGSVSVEARPGPERVRIEVRDDGPGFPHATPADFGTTRARRGRGGRPRGRGLAIAAEIASRHGGRLAAIPGADGACLALELPAAPIPGRA